VCVIYKLQQQGGVGPIWSAVPQKKNHHHQMRNLLIKFVIRHGAHERLENFLSNMETNLET